MHMKCSCIDIKFSGALMSVTCRVCAGETDSLRRNVGENMVCGILEVTAEAGGGGVGQCGHSITLHWTCRYRHIDCGFVDLAISRRPDVGRYRA